MALSVSRLVRVLINLSPLAAARRSFGVLMAAGDSNVINGVERFRTYLGIDGVAADFGTSAPEYKAAVLYFGQTPKPRQMMIGRWIRTATAAQNIGKLLTASQQLLSNWTSITNGGLVIVIDGVTKTLTGLNFSGATNLNGVADVINLSLTGGSIAWNGASFVVTSATTGAGSKAMGTITLSAAPAPSDTVTIQGTVVTFVASAPTGNQVLIGADAIETSTNLQAFLSTSLNANLILMTYATVNNVTTLTSVAGGTTGNAYTLAKSGTNIAISGAVLSGGTNPSSVSYATNGSGTNVSPLLGLTSSTAIALIPGFSAETPVECAAILANKSPLWYGLMFAASVMPTVEQNNAVAEFVEALDLRRMFGITITDTSVLSSLVSNDQASLLRDLGLKQTFCQYSANAYAVASMFGRAFSVNFNANRSTITLMYKQEPGVAPESLDENQANTLQAKRCNVFVSYVNDTNIIQYGVMSGPAYFDEIHGLDWFQDAVQNACYNALYQSKSKIPQTDAGANILTNAVDGACEEAVNNGLAAPGQWNAEGFGELETGQYLKTGYYVYTAPMATQSQADRETRVAPPIQVALKLAGAIQELDVLIDVNR